MVALPASGLTQERIKFPVGVSSKVLGSDILGGMTARIFWARRAGRAGRPDSRHRY